jgi:hypothetical protein
MYQGALNHLSGTLHEANPLTEPDVVHRNSDTFCKSEQSDEVDQQVQQI